jgi:hypothetical protein
MHPTSRPCGRTPISRHAVLLSRGVPALCLALLLVVAVGCASSGYVTTSTGAIVPASVVQAQDITGDALSVLQDVHNAAVMAHDAKAGTEPAEAHAKRRATLQASAAGLRASWDGLAAWKLGSEGAGMASVVGHLRSALPELLNAAVSLGVVSREYADVIGAFFGTASQGLTPKPLEKEGAPR